MGDFFGFAIIRGIIVFLGQVIRYIFYKILGSNRTFRSYSNELNDDYEDMGAAMKEETNSLIVGLVFLFLIVFLILKIDSCSK